MAVGVVMAIFFLLVGLATIRLTPVITGQLGNFVTSTEQFTRDLGAPDPHQSPYMRWNPVVQASPEGQGGVDKFIRDAKPMLDFLGVPANKRAIVDQYVAPYNKQIANYARTFFKSFLGLVAGFGSQLLMLMILTPMLVAYILSDMDRLKRRMASWVPPSIRASTVELASDVSRVFVNYLRGVMIALLLYMAGSATVLTILGAPYSVLLGMLFGCLYLIPYVGALISFSCLFLICGLSGQTNLLFFQTSSSWQFAFFVLIIYAVFDRAFDMLVYPRIVGRSVGLNALVSMFVVVSGGALFGLVGMIVAFPLAGAVKVILDRLMRVTSGVSENLNLPTVPQRHRTSG